MPCLNYVEAIKSFPTYQPKVCVVYLSRYLFTINLYRDQFIFFKLNVFKLHSIIICCHMSYIVHCVAILWTKQKYLLANNCVVKM